MFSAGGRGKKKIIIIIGTGDKWGEGEGGGIIP